MVTAPDPASQVAAESETGVPARPSRWQRMAPVVAAYSIPMAIFALTRVIQAALVSWMITDKATVRDRLLSWDSGWFVRVARDGYPHGYTYGDNGQVEANGLAFFPGFPMLIRFVHFVSGLSFENAALVVGTLSGLVATVAVYALGANLYDNRVGIVLATLFCCQPMSVVLAMGYSEGLFVAFTAIALVMAYRESWLLTGVFGLAAALTRPTGAAVAVAVAVAVGMHLVRDGLRTPGGGLRWRPVLAAVMALAGVPGYLIWVGVRTGNWHAWFDIQTGGWGTTFDAGSSALDFVVDALHKGENWVQISVAWMLIAVVVLAVLAVVRRVWTPLLVYGLIALVLVLGQAGFYHSKPRLLVPVLFILVPPAVSAARSRSTAAVAAVAGYVAFGLWYGAYLITIWHFAI